MSDSSRRVKPSSVAAFLWMPQLHLSFQHFSFIVPVFIRTVALMFVQAGLLPQDHPAVHYGMEGVKKYKFSELIGEAWYRLRSTQATPYQWGLFASVVLMVVFIILSFFTTLLNVSGMLIGNASAQIFDSALGPTDTASVPATWTGGLFNKVLAAPGTAHGDYGIAILDKMLREGVQGVGGPLQNALGSLMQIYNTGVLVIAGIMLFWCVLSVVVDTAKTGVIGGGRHNMVWAPIRIVFALGLLIPLGGVVGFSSGQMMVMKLAEWGSNFGTRAWVQYIGGVVADSSIMLKAGPKNMTTLVSEYEKMWLCRVAYNGHEYQTAAPINPAQLITDKNQTGMFDFGKKSYSFSNDTASNICGTVTYGTALDPALVVSAAVGDPVFGVPTRDFKRDVMNAYASLFIVGGTLEANARRFACGFVAQHIYASAGPQPLVTDCAASPAPQCNSGAPGSGQYPDQSCINQMISDAYTTIQGNIDTYQTNYGTAVIGNMLTSVQNTGWAGMGSWYHQISTLNNNALSAQEPTVTITGGEYSTTESTSEHITKVREVVKQYDTWWQTVPTTTAVGAPSVAASHSGATDPDKPKSTGFFAKVKSAVSSVKTADGAGFTSALINIVLGDTDKGYFLFDIAEPTSPNTYPLAELAKAGRDIMAWGVGLMASVTLLQAGLGFLSGTIGVGPFSISLGAVGETTAASMLFHLLSSAGSMCLLAGTMLAFLVPLIPFVRTVFSVMTWMVSVFEAVMMVPVAALAHLTTEGEGLAGHAKGAWLLWLNVLLRPVLTVVGFVAALLLFNTFVVYFHDIFTRLTIANLHRDGLLGLFAGISNTIIYVGIIYTAANSLFKLLDLMPEAAMKWLGSRGDTSFDADGGSQQYLGAMAQAVQGMGGAAGKGSLMPKGMGISWRKPTATGTP